MKVDAVQESMVPTMSSGSTEVEDELLMADLPEGLLDRFEQMSIQDDIAAWIGETASLGL